MTIKEYVKRVIEKNNEKLIAIIQNLNQTLLQSINSGINESKTYTDQQISAIPEVQTYTREEIDGFIQEAINAYDLQQKLNFKTRDNKYIKTSDNKIFIGGNSNG